MNANRPKYKGFIQPGKYIRYEGVIHKINRVDYRSGGDIQLSVTAVYSVGTETCNKQVGYIRYITISTRIAFQLLLKENETSKLSMLGAI